VASKAKRCPVAPISINEMDVSKIAPRLYQGGLEEFHGCQIAISGVNLVVKLTSDDTDTRILWPDLIEFPLEDEVEDLQYLSDLNTLAGKIARSIRNGDKVAIFCRQGRNRSGLLTGLVLRRLYKWDGLRIVNHIRSRRADALYGGGGDHFAEWFVDNF